MLDAGHSECFGVRGGPVQGRQAKFLREQVLERVALPGRVEQHEGGDPGVLQLIADREGVSHVLYDFLACNHIDPGIGQRFRGGR